MLTKKQQQLLIYIHKRLQKGGVSPSFDEMKDALGLKSKSGVHRLVTALEERGFLKRLPNRARALEVIKLPPGLAEPLLARNAPSNVVHADFRKRGGGGGEAVELPLYGRIAAGAAIEALSDPDSTVDVPAAMLGRGDHFALEVSGDSMIEAGIFDGDTAIIAKSDNAPDGTIIAALTDEGEVTLKRLFRRGGKVHLEPENPAYDTQVYAPSKVRIQGRLVALIRRY